MTEYGLAQRSKNFYELHLGRAVNVHIHSGPTFSGDVAYFDRSKNVIGLRNYLATQFSRNGEMTIIESPDVMEIYMDTVMAQELTTREDRLGRISRRNYEILTEGLAQEEHRRNLQIRLSPPVKHRTLADKLREIVRIIRS